MAEEESNTCTICGGVRRIDWTISFEECHPVEMRFDPASLAGNWRLCPGHPEPVRIQISRKHDGNLDEQGWGDVEITEVWSCVQDKYVQGVHISSLGRENESTRVDLDPVQALSLLDWLQQNKPELQRLAGG